MTYEVLYSNGDRIVIEAADERQARRLAMIEKWKGATVCVMKPHSPLECDRGEGLIVSPVS